LTSSSSFLAERRSDVRETKLWSPFRHVNKMLARMVEDMVDAAELKPSARVLDLGCADKPYRDLLPMDISYTGADLPGNTWADVHLTPQGTVPVADSSFELVLSTQVLEHVEAPTRYLAECHRVLEEGGSLMLSTHGLMYYHPDPTDHWRWTHTGLTKIVEDAGFDVVQVRGVIGAIPASLQILQVGVAWRLPRFLRALWNVVMQTLVSVTDRIDGEERKVQNSLVIWVHATKRVDRDVIR
jgi:SAM-dependent methyltransferase